MGFNIQQIEGSGTTNKLVNLVPGFHLMPIWVRFRLINAWNQLKSDNKLPYGVMGTQKDYFMKVLMSAYFHDIFNNEEYHQLIKVIEAHYTWLKTYPKSEDE